MRYTHNIMEIHHESFISCIKLLLFHDVKLVFDTKNTSEYNKNMRSEISKNHFMDGWMILQPFFFAPGILSPPRFPPGSRFRRTCRWRKGCFFGPGASKGHGECRAGVLRVLRELAEKGRYGCNTSKTV